MPLASSASSSQHRPHVAFGRRISPPRRRSGPGGRLEAESEQDNTRVYRHGLQRYTVERVSDKERIQRGYPSPSHIATQATRGSYASLRGPLPDARERVTAREATYAPQIHDVTQPQWTRHPLHEKRKRKRHVAWKDKQVPSDILPTKTPRDEPTDIRTTKTPFDDTDQDGWVLVSRPSESTTTTTSALKKNKKKKKKKRQPKPRSDKKTTRRQQVQAPPPRLAPPPLSPVPEHPVAPQPIVAKEETPPQTVDPTPTPDHKTDWPADKETWTDQPWHAPDPQAHPVEKSLPMPFEPLPYEPDPSRIDEETLAPRPATPPPLPHQAGQHALVHLEQVRIQQEDGNHTDHTASGMGINEAIRKQQAFVKQWATLFQVARDEADMEGQRRRQYHQAQTMRDEFAEFLTDRERAEAAQAQFAAQRGAAVDDHWARIARRKQSQQDIAQLEQTVEKHTDALRAQMIQRQQDYAHAVVDDMEHDRARAHEEAVRQALDEQEQAVLLRGRTNRKQSPDSSASTPARPTRQRPWHTPTPAETRKKKKQEKAIRRRAMAKDVGNVMLDVANDDARVTSPGNDFLNTLYELHGIDGGVDEAFADDAQSKKRRTKGHANKKKKKKKQSPTPHEAESPLSDKRQPGDIVDTVHGNHLNALVARVETVIQNMDLSQVLQRIDKNAASTRQLESMVRELEMRGKYDGQELRSDVDRLSDLMFVRSVLHPEDDPVHKDDDKDASEAGKTPRSMLSAPTTSRLFVTPPRPRRIEQSEFSQFDYAAMDQEITALHRARIAMKPDESNVENIPPMDAHAPATMADKIAALVRKMDWDPALQQLKNEARKRALANLRYVYPGALGEDASGPPAGRAPSRARPSAESSRRSSTSFRSSGEAAQARKARILEQRKAAVRMARKTVARSPAKPAAPKPKKSPVHSTLDAASKPRRSQLRPAELFFASDPLPPSELAAVQPMHLDAALSVMAKARQEHEAVAAASAAARHAKQRKRPITREEAADAFAASAVTAPRPAPASPAPVERREAATSPAASLAAEASATFHDAATSPMPSARGKPQQKEVGTDAVVATRTVAVGSPRPPSSVAESVASVAPEATRMELPLKALNAAMEATAGVEDGDSARRAEERRRIMKMVLAAYNVQSDEAVDAEWARLLAAENAAREAAAEAARLAAEEDAARMRIERDQAQAEAAAARADAERASQQQTSPKASAPSVPHPAATPPAVRTLRTRQSELEDAQARALASNEETLAEQRRVHEEELKLVREETERAAQTAAHAAEVVDLLRKEQQERRDRDEEFRVRMEQLAKAQQEALSGQHEGTRKYMDELKQELGVVKDFIDSAEARRLLGDEGAVAEEKEERSLAKTFGRRHARPSSSSSEDKSVSGGSLSDLVPVRSSFYLSDGEIDKETGRVGGPTGEQWMKEHGLLASDGGGAGGRRTHPDPSMLRASVASVRRSAAARRRRARSHKEHATPSLIGAAEASDEDDDDASISTDSLELDASRTSRVEMGTPSTSSESDEKPSLLARRRAPPVSLSRAAGGAGPAFAVDSPTMDDLHSRYSPSMSMGRSLNSTMMSRASHNVSAAHVAISPPHSEELLDADFEDRSPLHVSFQR